MDFYSLNESTDCAPGYELQNGTLYESLDPANITCGNTFAVRIPEVPERKQKAEDHTLRILLYALIFLLSVLGNLLIIVVLAVNRRMRTVTNSFLLSLAVSDLMMAVFCMPFNLIPNILKDFIFGAAMCRIVAYLMGISVSISTFSLVAIAIERYSAICNPLKSRSWQTRSHAYRVIAATWLLAFVLMIPYPVISHLEAHQRPDNTTAHKCRHMWPQVKAEQTWFILLLMVLFVIPGVVMIVAYGLISRELYRGIQFEMGQKRVSAMLKNGLATAAGASSGGNDDGDGCYVHNAAPQQPPHPSVEMSTLSASSGGGGVARQVEEPPRLRSNTSEAKLEAKKRVIRMLVVIVAMFFVCWMPLYCVNTWRAFDSESAVLALSGAPISFILLLSYSSACVNPVIYCFMNTRFRKALLSTFACRGDGRQSLRRSRRRGGLEEDAMTTGTSVSRFSYTTVSSAGTC